MLRPCVCESTVLFSAVVLPPVDVEIGDLRMNLIAVGHKQLNLACRSWATFRYPYVTSLANQKTLCMVTCLPYHLRAVGVSKGMRRLKCCNGVMTGPKTPIFDLITGCPHVDFPHSNRNIFFESSESTNLRPDFKYAQEKDLDNTYY